MSSTKYDQDDSHTLGMWSVCRQTESRTSCYMGECMGRDQWADQGSAFTSCAALFLHDGATSCNYSQLRCAAPRCPSASFYELRCFLLVILHKSYHSFTHELRCAARVKHALCFHHLGHTIALYNQSQKTCRCCRCSNTSPLKILNCIEQIINIWCMVYCCVVSIESRRKISAQCAYIGGRP